jgi:hypothetical protein
MCTTPTRKTSARVHLKHKEAANPATKQDLKRKRKDSAFRRQFNEKPSVTPGCPGKQDLTFSMAEHWTSGTARSLPARPRKNRAAADCRKNASALLHLIWSISMPKPEATPGLIKACSSGLHKQPHRIQVRHQKAGCYCSVAPRHR